MRACDNDRKMDEITKQKTTQEDSDKDVTKEYMERQPTPPDSDSYEEHKMMQKSQITPRTPPQTPSKEYKNPALRRSIRLNSKASDSIKKEITDNEMGALAVPELPKYRKISWEEHNLKTIDGIKNPNEGTIEEEESPSLWSGAIILDDMDEKENTPNSSGKKNGSTTTSSILQNKSPERISPIEAATSFTRLTKEQAKQIIEVIKGIENERNQWENIAKKLQEEVATLTQEISKLRVEISRKEEEAEKAKEEKEEQREEKVMYKKLENLILNKFRELERKIEGPRPKENIIQKSNENEGPRTAPQDDSECPKPGSTVRKEDKKEKEQNEKWTTVVKNNKQKKTNKPCVDQRDTETNDTTKKVKPASSNLIEKRKNNGIKTLQDLIPDLLKKDKPMKIWARVTAKPSSKHTVDSLRQMFDPAKEGIEITSTRKAAGTKQMYVQTETMEDLEKLQGSATLKEGGFEVERINAKLPRIIIYDIDSGLTKERITEEIRQKNDQVGNASEEDFRLIFNINSRRKGLSHWVAETTAQIRKAIMEGQNRKIKTAWTRNKVDDYLDAPRCFNCQRYGHISKHCTHKNITCGHCGQSGHRYKECLNKDKPPVCTPCKLAGSESNHDVHNKDCPSKLRAIKERMKNTSYAC